MNYKRYNFYLLAGLAILLGLEFSIYQPKFWYIHLVTLGVIQLLARLQIGDFKINGWYRVVNSLVVPGIGMLFFINITIWQHFYVIILAILVAYLFYWLKIYITNPNSDKPTLIFSLSSIFFTIALALGLHIFFRLSIAYTAGVVFLLIVYFPVELVISLRQGSAGTNFVSDNLKLKRSVSLWFKQSIKKGYLQQPITFKWLNKGFFKHIQITRFKLLLLLLSLELYLIIINLPVNIVVSSAVVTVILFSLVSLLQYAQLKLLNRNLIIRYLGASLFLVIIILITAQWS